MPPSSAAEAKRLLPGAPQKLGATPLEDFLAGKELGAEVERDRRALRLEPHAVLSRNVGETARDIGPAGKHDAFDL